MSQADLVYVSMCEVVSMCLGLCVTAVCFYSTAKLPAILFYYINIKEPNNTYCSERSLCNPLFTVLFFSTCFKSVFDI